MSEPTPSTEAVHTRPLITRWEDVWAECRLGATERTWVDGAATPFYVSSSSTSSTFYECKTFHDVDLITNVCAVFNAALGPPAPVTWIVDDVPFCKAAALPYGLPLPVGLTRQRLIVARSDSPFTVQFKYAALTDDEKRALSTVVESRTNIAFERVPDAERVAILHGQARLLLDSTSPPADE